MGSDQHIDIDYPEWRIIPPELEDGLSRRSLSKRRLLNWTLVLQARQIPCRSEIEAGNIQLLVPITYFNKACEELRIFEEQNRNWPPAPPAEHPQQENSATTIWVLIVLGLFHLLTQKQLTPFSNVTIDWYALGNADAGKILAGEWWRLVTSLTLHSGGIHLAGNIIIGGIVINRLCRDLGSGRGWSLVLASGILGNLANALVQSPNHHSIGASTAVFGAVGLLAAINMLRYRTSLHRRWPLPIAAAAGLLALLGAGGENTDIGAHLFGFAFGVGLGFLTGVLAKHSKYPPFSTDRIIAIGCAASVLLCWWCALQI